jgi:hypothetical protein
MKFLYIGQYSEGTTSRMRADILRSLLPGSDFSVIDIHIPFYRTNLIARSLGFRYKTGPLVGNINRYILSSLSEILCDVIWVDKAILITRRTTEILRERTRKLVHFTPDPAFTFHHSSHFTRSLQLYDHAITSKSYELEQYRKILGKDKVILTTQGFDINLHKPWHSYNDKKTGVTFVGHWEKEREEIISALLKQHIHTIVTGRGWKKFSRRNRTNLYFEYIGEGVYGEDYARLISGYTFSLGLVSKWIPEKHTTRTFEIPACGTALITERNEETSRFFRDDEVIFYDSIPELVSKIKYYMTHKEELEVLSSKGYNRVIQDGNDYGSILRGLLAKMGITD